MDCPVCASAKGLKDKELVEHMKTHKDNPDLLIERFADYVADGIDKKHHPFTEVS